MNDKLKCTGIYDSGSNITLINSKLIKVRDSKINYFENKFNTICGGGKTTGLVKLNGKMLGIEEEINAFICNDKNFTHELLLGLDTIKKFGLTHDGNLNIQLQKNANPRSSKYVSPTGNKKYNYSEIETKEHKSQILNYEINFNEGINVNKFDIDTSYLEDDQKTKINVLLDDYKHLFAKDKFDVGQVKNYEAFIDLQVDKYCSKRPYRCSLGDREEIEKQISQLLKNELIEESYSPFAAPVTLAFKRDEGKKSRLCIDFRDLNKIIVPQPQPFPLIEDLMVKTINCKYFTTLDINSAFWSIPLRISDRAKTGFVTQEGHYQWTCLPFGLKTSPAIFQRILTNIIRKHNLSNYVMNFIDDIMVFSKTFDDHMDHLSKLLNAIAEEGFRLKLTKCKFAAQSVRFLGHSIKGNIITPLKDNLKSIAEFPAPLNKKQIRQFLGKVNFYNKYIPNAAITLDPLHNLLRKNINYVWSADCEKAFQTIKSHLCSAPILAIFDREAPTFIYTDASIKGIGAILKQTQKCGEIKPVAYFSKKLNECQKKKKAIFLECLAIKESLRFWQHWLIGNSFTIYTDHKPLENLNIKNRTDDELGDMTHYLSQYNFVIKYHPGRNNTEADCLSRNPVYESHENEEDNLKTINIIKFEEILDDQNKNSNIKNKHNFIRENDIYYKRNNKKNKIVLSEDYSKVLIKKVHEHYCHIGINQIESKIRPFYTAPNLLDNIKLICRQCEVCIKNKTRLNRKYGLMSQLGPAEKPFQIMSIDTVGGFGGKRSSKRYLHLLMDHFTRYAYISCSKTQLAKDFIKLIDRVIKDNEVEILLSDQYPALNSEEFKRYLKDHSVNLIFTAVDAPFSNGHNERLNQTLVNRIRCTLNSKGNKKSWTTVVMECVKAYNLTNHTVTGYSPLYLLSGEPTDLLPTNLNRKQMEPGELEKDRKIAFLRSKKSHELNKAIFDKNRIDHKFQKGDMVYIMDCNKLNRSKMDEIRIGPFEIQEIISNSICRINTGKSKKSLGYYHVTKLIPQFD